MAVVFSNNATSTHLVITRTQDELYVPVDDVFILVNPYGSDPDEIRLCTETKHTFLQFLTADSNLVGATTADRIADLINTYLPSLTGSAGSGTAPFEIVKAPSTYPCYVQDCIQYATTSATDTFNYDISGFILPELAAAGQVEVTLRMFAQPTPGGPPVDSEEYKWTFSTAALVATEVPGTRDRVSALPATNYVTGLGYDGGNNMTITVVNGSNPTEITYTFWVCLLLKGI